MRNYPLSCQETNNDDDFCGYVAGHSGDCSFVPHSSRKNLHVGRHDGSGAEGSYFDKVAEFHRTAQVAAPTRPSLEAPLEFALSLNLINEETQELVEAYEASDLVEVADALCDLVYVTLRAGYMAGLPMDRLFAEVHRSNMSKFPNGEVIRRADGKILKPESWTPPQLKEIIDGSV